MAWATQLIEQLKQGKTVTAHPRGNSMAPKIRSGDQVEIRPLEESEVLSKGDIVLCKVNGTEYLHLISAVRGEQFQISNNRGRVNGWIRREKIYGKLVRVGPKP